MTTSDLVQRVKTLNQADSANQVEKFVTELLTSSKYSKMFMIRMYRRAVLEELKRRR